MTDSTNLDDVVIIGAGLAGLTCARKLQSAGQKLLQNVRI
jgi:flavin-dependent dehydrogenase